MFVSDIKLSAMKFHHQSLSTRLSVPDDRSCMTSYQTPPGGGYAMPPSTLQALLTPLHANHSFVSMTSAMTSSPRPLDPMAGYALPSSALSPMSLPGDALLPPPAPNSVSPSLGGVAALAGPLPVPVGARSVIYNGPTPPSEYGGASANNVISGVDHENNNEEVKTEFINLDQLRPVGVNGE